MNNYDELDLLLIKQSVSNNASFDMSREYILNEEVSFNPIVIRDNLRKTKEAMKIISLHGRFEFTELKDISKTLSSLKKGLTLTSFELLEVYEHNAEVRRIARYFRSVDEIDELTDFTESLFYNDDLMHNISSKIDNSGEVKHNASERLKNLYVKSQSVEARINETAREFIRNNASSMQESLLYYRNNRACFLLKNTDKNKPFLLYTSVNTPISPKIYNKNIKSIEVFLSNNFTIHFIIFINIFYQNRYNLIILIITIYQNRNIIRSKNHNLTIPMNFSQSF